MRLLREWTVDAFGKPGNPMLMAKWGLSQLTADGFSGPVVVEVELGSVWAVRCYAA